MSFVKTNVNYATQYAKDIQGLYPYLSYYSRIWGGANSQKYKPVYGKTVAIPSIEVGGAHAADRDNMSGSFSRKWNNEWQTVTCAMDREWDTLIDPMDIVETNEVATIANVTRAFNEQQKIPEMDSYMSYKLAGFANASGAIDSTTLTAANILEYWDYYLQYMADRRVPRNRLVAYVDSPTYRLLKQASGITRFVEVGSETGINRNVASLDGIAIVEVPSDMMRQAYDYTDGWAIGASAGHAHMIIVDPDAIVAPVVYETSMIGAPTAQSKGKYLYYERYYYDVFCLAKRTAGVFANVTAALSSLGSLTVASVAGTASGDSKVTATGAKGYDNTALFYIAGSSPSAPTAGTAITVGSGNYAPFVNGADYTLTSGQKVQVVEANIDTLKPIAYGSATIVVKS